MLEKHMRAEPKQPENPIDRCNTKGYSLFTTRGSIQTIRRAPARREAWLLFFRPDCQAKVDDSHEYERLGAKGALAGHRSFTAN